MLGFARSDVWIMSSRRGGRGRSFDEADQIARVPLQPETLIDLCLRSILSSLGKGLATLSLQELPLGLAEKIYNFVFLRGSRMAQMEVSRALAPILAEHVDSIDLSKGAKFVGDSALLELANGCESGLLHLDLNACPFVTDTGIVSVLLKCPAIRSLSLSGCHHVTDQVRFVTRRKRRVYFFLTILGQVLTC